MTDPSRPDPDQLLKVVEHDRRAEQRGHLKIFFGSSAGVGKTYAMLEAAHAARREGLDVVVGIVETHGRPETARLLEGLPLLPRKSVNHKNVRLEEFDLDAALARKPAILLIDEMAHTNAPDCRHVKRWQDIDELLAAGIGVYTTLNVQHLESLNDVVASITGVSVFETVPDELFDEADDIKLVDLSTEDLLERLKNGQVYVTEGAADRAAQNFFSKTNLMSLRELALRRAADYVDADTDDQRIRAGLLTPNIAGDRVLVCVGADMLAAKLVRSARRIATSLKAPWYALAVETSDVASNTRGARHRLRALRIAEQNGAHVVTLQDENLCEAILNYARSKGVTKIIIGHKIHAPWLDWIKGSLVEHVIRRSGDIDVYVITGASSKGRSTKARMRRATFADYGVALALAAFFTGVGVVLEPALKPIDQVMLDLIGVVLAAARLGCWPALLTALMSVLGFNFFFVEPRYTLDVSNPSYWLTFLVMLITSWVISSQAERLRLQAVVARRRERETQTLYTLSKELAATRGDKNVIQATLKHLVDATDGEAVVWLDNGNDSFTACLREGAVPDKLYFRFGADDSDAARLKEEMVAKWCCENRQPAGLGTDTLPSAKAYHYPLIGTRSVFGVLAFAPAVLHEELSAEDKTTVETFAALLASALDRIETGRITEQMWLNSETEKLKNTFLNSMSHDLRSPLAAIRGSAETLLDTPQTLSEATKKGLCQTIFQEADRLSRVVNNLLHLTRLETGQLQLNTQTCSLPELIGAVLQYGRKALVNIRIETQVSEDLPLMRVDGLLIEQLLQNLLENAAAFSPAQGVVVLAAWLEADGVVLSVADHGPGVPAGYEPKIFDKFFTMQQRDRPKGAGLGLAICHAICQLHGGKIWVEANPGGGALFKVLLPKALSVSSGQPQNGAVL